jgi:hypothetical protein
MIPRVWNVGVCRQMKDIALLPLFPPIGEKRRHCKRRNQLQVRQTGFLFNLAMKSASQILARFDGTARHLDSGLGMMSVPEDKHFSAVRALSRNVGEDFRDHG